MQASPSRWRTAFTKVGGLDWGKSRLMRYSVPCADMAAWTARTLATLAADGDAEAHALSERTAANVYACASTPPAAAARNETLFM